MIDHFTLTVSNLGRSKAFYNRALAPLGYKLLMDFGQAVGYGDEKKPYFWLKEGPEASRPMHIAFQAKNRAAVDAFHSAALAAGARDDGRPGLREMYHPNYYGSFVIELDGHPIEAVCHAAPGGAKKAPAKKPAAKKAAPRKTAKKSRAKPARSKKRR
jgi:catechol 2,3-dioxygenase-like lactoylglutathione lyase family enzyme